MQNKGACGGACQASNKCLNWTRIIFGVLAIGSMVTAVIFYAVPEAGDFPTKQIVQATSTVATCVFGTVGLFTHGALMENKFKESSKLGKTNFILGIFGFLIVMAAPVLFMCGIGPVVGSIIGGTGALLLLIPLIEGICNHREYGMTQAEKQEANGLMLDEVFGVSAENPTTNIDDLLELKSTKSQSKASAKESDSLDDLAEMLDFTSNGTSKASNFEDLFAPEEGSNNTDDLLDLTPTKSQSKASEKGSNSLDDLLDFTSGKAGFSRASAKTDRRRLASPIHRLMAQINAAA